jgi:hypothetical protein
VHSRLLSSISALPAIRSLKMTLKNELKRGSNLLLHLPLLLKPGRLIEIPLPLLSLLHRDLSLGMKAIFSNEVS